MTAHIKAMSDQITQLTKAIANKENAPNGGGGGGSGGRNKGQARREDVQYNKLRTWVATVYHMVSILPA